MQKLLADLIEEAKQLRVMADAQGAGAGGTAGSKASGGQLSPLPGGGGGAAAVVAAMLGAAIDAGDAGAGDAGAAALALESAIDAFHDLPLEDRQAMLNGWMPAGEPAMPPREELMAVEQLAGIRRVLVVDVTSRAFIPSHEWVLRDSSPVRVEIHAGTTWPEVRRALDRLLRMLPVYWEMLIDEDGAAAVAKEYQRVDLRAGTIDGIAVDEYTGRPGDVAGMEDGSNAP
jgi:hypothetical protein